MFGTAKLLHPTPSLFVIELKLCEKIRANDKHQGRLLTDWDLNLNLEPACGRFKAAI
jgi:hypothetical protein